MQLRVNQNPNTIQTHDEPIVAIYLARNTHDGSIEVCADTDKVTGCLLARITPDGVFRPNRHGASNAGLESDYRMFREN